MADGLVDGFPRAHMGQAATRDLVSWDVEEHQNVAVPDNCAGHAEVEDNYIIDVN